jgi:hypothetical protein
MPFDIAVVSVGNRWAEDQYTLKNRMNRKPVPFPV